MVLILDLRPSTKLRKKTVYGSRISKLLRISLNLRNQLRFPTKGERKQNIKKTLSRILNKQRNTTRDFLDCLYFFFKL